MKPHKVGVFDFFFRNKEIANPSEKMLAARVIISAAGTLGAEKSVRVGMTQYVDEELIMPVIPMQRKINSSYERNLTIFATWCT